jgi:hypothetical protein
MNQPSFLQAEVVLDGRVIAATGAEGDFKAARMPRLQRTVRYSFQRTYSEHYRLTKDFDNWKKGFAPFAEVSLSEQPAVNLLPRRAPFPDYSINGPFKKLSTAKTIFDAKRKLPMLASSIEMERMVFAAHSQKTSLNLTGGILSSVSLQQKELKTTLKETLSFPKECRLYTMQGLTTLALSHFP